MTDDQLLSIINATTDSLDRMNNLHANVVSQAENYIRANNSDSGRTMQGRLVQWTQDFYRIKQNLERLNEKVSYVRQNNRDHASDAVTAAQGAGR